MGVRVIELSGSEAFIGGENRVGDRAYMKI